MDRRVLRRCVARARDLFACEQWAIGIVRAPIAAFLDPRFVPVVNWIRSPRPHEFLADCFGVISGGRRWILAERFTYKGISHITANGREPVREGRGHITCIALDENGCPCAEHSAIDSGKHMSFPFTIFDSGSWYVVAEELSAGIVNLYRETEPGRWHHSQIILQHPLVDPSIIYHLGRWWMFGTTASCADGELQIWYADRLEGEWVAHRSNPVRCSLYNARPAGTPFIHDSVLYRPTQNSTSTYGGSIVINKVEKLTPDSFLETPVHQIFPPADSPFTIGMHTLSTFGNWTLIDAKRYVLLPDVTARRLARLFAALIRPRNTGGMSS